MPCVSKGNQAISLMKLCLLKLMSIASVMPSTISFSVVPFSSHLQSFPASGSFPMSQLFTSNYWMAKVLELQYQSFQRVFRVDFFQSWLVWSPCCPRGSQESSPALQFESINSSVLSLLYGPTLTSVHGETLALTTWTFVGKVMSLHCLCL